MKIDEYAVGGLEESKGLRAIIELTDKAHRADERMHLPVYSFSDIISILDSIPDERHYLIIKYEDKESKLKIGKMSRGARYTLHVGLTSVTDGTIDMKLFQRLKHEMDESMFTALAKDWGFQ